MMKEKVLQLRRAIAQSVIDWTSQLAGANYEPDDKSPIFPAAVKSHIDLSCESLPEGEV